MLAFHLLSRDKIRRKVKFIYVFVFALVLKEIRIIRIIIPEILFFPVNYMTNYMVITCKQKNGNLLVLKTYNYHELSINFGNNIEVDPNI